MHLLDHVDFKPTAMTLNSNESFPLMSKCKPLRNEGMISSAESEPEHTSAFNL